MKILGIRSVIVRKYNPGPTKSKVDDTNKPNLLNQEFKAKRLREKLVSDITYIYTKESGCTYLAIVMDLYSLSVIGYSYGTSMDADLVVQAIKNARKNGKFKKKAIFHSDLGSQFTSNKVEEYLTKVLNRIVLPGSIFLALIAIIPSIIINMIPEFPSSMAYLLGGTSLIIIVGVDLDTMSQIEGYLKMYHYDGIVKKGKIRSRNF